MRRLYNLKFMLFVLILFSTGALAQSTYPGIKDYKIYFGEASQGGHDWITLRQFMAHNKFYYLLVDPNTLRTKVDESRFYSFRPITWDDVKSQFKHSPYIR